MLLNIGVRTTTKWMELIGMGSSKASSSSTLVIFNSKLEEFNCSACGIVFDTSCEIKTPHESTSPT